MYSSAIWSDYIIILSLLIVIFTIYIGKQMSELLKFGNLEKLFTIKKLNGLFIFSAWGHLKKKTYSNKERLAVFAFQLLLPLIYYGLDYILSINGIELQFQYLVVIPLILSIMIIQVSVKNISYFFFIIKYESENNIVLYTSLFEYILIEDDINQWRKTWKSLKPVKINGIFFNGDISK